MMGENVPVIIPVGLTICSTGTAVTNRDAAGQDVHYDTSLEHCEGGEREVCPFQASQEVRRCCAFLVRQEVLVVQVI